MVNRPLSLLTGRSSLLTVFASTSGDDDSVISEKTKADSVSVATETEKKTFPAPAGNIAREASHFLRFPSNIALMRVPDVRLLSSFRNAWSVTSAASISMPTRRSPRVRTWSTTLSLPHSRLGQSELIGGVEHECLELSLIARLPCQVIRDRLCHL